MYYFGAGVRRDYEKAAAMFKETSEAGLGKADYDLGRLYYRGQGVEKDAAKAAAHFRKAAKKGHGEAQFFMGRLYMLGLGVEKDPAKAYYWLTLSIAQDKEKAAKLRRKVKWRPRFETNRSIGTGRASVSPELTDGGQIAARVTLVAG